MPTLTIIVKGIGICYRKDPYWKILFPFDRHHKLKLEIVGHNTLTLGIPQETISIEAMGATSTFGENNSDFDRFINITGNNGHSRGIRPLIGGNSRYALLTIKDGVFFQDEPTKCSYSLIKKQDSVVPPGTAYAVVGYSARIEVTGEKFSIAAQHIPGSPIQISSDSTIKLDNTCEKCNPDGDADFELIYNMVEDVDDPDREFTIVRDPKDDASPLTKIISAIAKILHEPIVFEVSDNPESGKIGMPCNLVVSGDSTNLP